MGKLNLGYKKVKPSIISLFSIDGLDLPYTKNMKYLNNSTWLCISRLSTIQ